MKKLMTLGFMASALMVPVLANAATADLKLIGTITPAACVPNFTGGATIDYGNIPASTLNSAAQTLLPEKTTKFAVTCNAPVKFAIALTDGRSASALTTLDTIATYTPDQKFGLGTASNGAKIGAYSLQMSNEVPDSGTARRLMSTNDGATWADFGGGIRTGVLIGFTAVGTSLTPAAYKSMIVDVRVVAAIDKSSNLPITNDIKIDGLSTIEVKYL